MGTIWDQMSGRERSAAVAIIVFIIASFFPMATVSVQTGVVSASESFSAWHSYAVVGLIFGIGGGLEWLRNRFHIGGAAKGGSDMQRILAGAIALGTVIVLIRVISWTGEGGTVDGAAVTVSLAWGLFVLLIAAIVAAFGITTSPDPRYS